MCRVGGVLGNLGMTVCCLPLFWERGTEPTSALDHLSTYHPDRSHHPLLAEHPLRLETARAGSSCECA